MSARRPATDSTPGEALADALLESSRPFAPLPQAAHARVKRRLKASLRRSLARRPRWLQPVLVSGVMLLYGAAFGIALDRLVLQRSPSSSTDPRSPAAPAKPPRRLKPAPPAAPAPAAPPVALAAPPPATSVEASHSAEPPKAATAPRVEAPASLANRAAGALPKLAMRPEPAHASGAAAPPVMAAELPSVPVAAPPVTAPAVAPLPREAPAPVQVAPPVSDGLSEERLLSAALRALRAQRNPPSALLALDEYRARFPRGRLAVEADVLRVDALVALHRDGEALVTLDRMDLVHMPGGLERQLQRGELRVSVARWQDAESDFDQVLSHARGRTHEVAERVLWGRIRCRLGVGDPRGARTAADEYLRRFPHGRFATQVEGLMHAGP